MFDPDDSQRADLISGGTSHEPAAPPAKVLLLGEIAGLAAAARASGKAVVFTNGCFDLLHVGHVRYLQMARRQGDLLFVGINGDRSVTGLKGPGRPLVPQDERAEVLAALSCVDAVCIFEDLRPDELVRAILPAVHVKGGDYTPDELPEASLMRSLGIEIRIMPLVPGRSTSRLARLLNGENSGEPL